MAEIKLTSKEHENFYKTMLQKSGNGDSYHRAFFYCIGISDTVRRNAKRIFDFEHDRIKPNGLHEGGQIGAKEIKTCTIHRDIKAIDKAATAAQRMKHSSVRVLRSRV